MTASVDRLYALLPPFYQQRDAAQGYPLQQLLQVIATQVNVLEEDIAQLYENWFIETCDTWVVPYIGDLIGHTPVNHSISAGVAKILVQRQDVADTIHFRRRKGTLALLEDISTAVTDWPSRVAESALSLCSTQQLDHLRLNQGRVVDLHDPSSLALLGTPFETSSRTLGLAGMNAPQSIGRFDVPSVVLFVWRLKVYSVTQGRAYCTERDGNHCYTFSILGNDMPLFHHPAAAVGANKIARELDLPTPIRRQAFAKAIVKERTTVFQASDDYYGEGKSMAIWAGNWAGCDPAKPVPAEMIVSADLSGWKYRPRHGHIAVDPELGRIAFPPTQLPDREIVVSYYYGSNSELGGGEYARPTQLFPASRFYYVGPGAEFPHIRAAHAQWTKEKPPHAVIQINDNGIYSDQLHFEIGENQYLELRAANRARPVIAMEDWKATRPDAMTISGRPGGRFVLDGLLISGRGIEIRGPLDQLIMRHCTLVPGWALNADCSARRTDQPSLQLVETSAAIEIESSILGKIEVVGGKERKTGRNRVQISDSVIDAVEEDGTAIHALGEVVAPFALRIVRSTILGRVESHAIELAENSIFTGEVFVARRQVGCMRFCYVPLGSRTPPRYECQPDLAESRVRTALKQAPETPGDAKAFAQEERHRLVPEFISTNYGQPNYCRLVDTSATELTKGADDQGEMGVFHDVFQAQKEFNLRTRLREYTPAGMDAGIVFAT